MERATRVVFTNILRGLARQLRDQDLSVAQLAALHVVDDRGTMRVNELADELATSLSSVSRLVDGLVQRGLVARDEDPVDRRARQVTLTEGGRALLREAGAARVKVVIEIMEKHAPAAVVRGVLRAMESLRRE